MDIAGKVHDGLILASQEQLNMFSFLILLLIMLFLLNFLIYIETRVATTTVRYQIGSGRSKAKNFTIGRRSRKSSTTTSRYTSSKIE